ncbi:DUF4062 domain-containing protein [Halobacillus sp. B23F22_1]|uniref:DUF4062 domain-containing protein n=1 Tax=Halobacillus sp. B23F22_1 TaxID=3459514 RepID=UPI00373EAEF4
MPNQCKLFISSAYDNQLIPLRKNLKEHLENAGHRPLLFEDNFYPWHEDFMKTCIEKVIESDIFILLINDNVGTYWDEEKCTPTYQEFRTAVKEDKYIITFIDLTVKQYYEDYIKADLTAKMEQYKKDNYRYPDYTIDAVDTVLMDLPAGQQERLKNIHPFIWAFIYDVQAQGIWTEELVLAQSPEFYKKINGYLSDRLKEGIKLVPMKEGIHENAIAARDFEVYQEYTLTLLSYLAAGTVSDWNEFLEMAKTPLKGGHIYQRPDTILEEAVGTFKDCNTITVYKKHEGKMKLCGYTGTTSPTLEYDLEDETSYVVRAYTTPQNMIGYSQNKNLLYYALNTSDYVLCFHYPLDHTWDKTKVKAFGKEIEYAIMEKTNILYTDFLADLIGGMKYDFK